ncbi:MAG TPA: ATP-binding cassette domain-containing protein [Rhodocyclaceae bacterium]|nr:ATP-binding cassette domain-containing protein [Rhodocyclaceae bacterium]
MFPIRLQNASFVPDGRPVLTGIDLEFGGDGITVVLGPNGAGKTILLRMIAGLQAPHDGSISWNGAGSPPPGISMVFQHPVLLRTSVFANGALGLRPLGLPGDEVRRRTRHVLSRVGLSDRAADSARLLSGGERQRLALARAWATAPRLLLLDEPTAALDPTATEAVEQIVREMRSEGVRIIMTTHNLGQAMRIADDIVFVAGGGIRERASATRFFARPESAEAKLFIQKELPWRIPFED